MNAVMCSQPEGFGASNLYLMRRHILPQALGVVFTQAALLIPQYILAEVMLSFFGLGIGEPMPSWGSMLGQPPAISRACFVLVDAFPGLRADPDFPELSAAVSNSAREVFVMIRMLTIVFHWKFALNRLARLRYRPDFARVPISIASDNQAPGEELLVTSGEMGYPEAGLYVSLRSEPKDTQSGHIDRRIVAGTDLAVECRLDSHRSSLSTSGSIAR